MSTFNVPSRLRRGLREDLGTEGADLVCNALRHADGAGFRRRSLGKHAALEVSPPPGGFSKSARAWLGKAGFTELKDGKWWRVLRGDDSGPKGTRSTAALFSK